MGRRALCIHGSSGVRTRLVESLPASFEGSCVADPVEGQVRHGHHPFDVVVVELDPDAAVVRQLRAWHPEPAIVAVAAGTDRAIDAALTSGAHDHLVPDADPRDVSTVVERSWRRHRADRTSRADRVPRPDTHEVRRRVSQLVSLMAAAQDLLDIDEPPHTTVRSLLDQAGELGQETVELTGRARAPEERTQLELPALVESAWGGRAPAGTTLQVELDDVQVHGHPAMLRTALIVLFTHALRGVEPAGRVHVDSEVLDEAVHLRVHDDGPAIGLGQRHALFVGGGEETTPMLMAVEHVAARHGGTAWLADSDVISGGTMAVVELPLRALPR